MRAQNALFATLLFLLLTFSSSLSAESPLKILRVTPSGEDVPAGRQVVLEFDRPVVPLGKMERSASELPITITPPLACDWRWLTASTLACQLGEKTALQFATKYSVVVKPGIMTTAGETLAAPFTATFITQRPAVASYWFTKWLSPTMPVINLSFTQPLSERSVNEHIYITRGDDPNVRIPVVVEERKAGEVSPWWNVQPVKELEPATRYLLQVEPGLLSKEGAEVGIERRVITEIETFPEFTFIGVECSMLSGVEKRYTGALAQGVEPQGGCDPLGSVALIFSSPVLKAQIKDALTVTPDLAAGRKDFDPWESVYSYSQLQMAHKKDGEYALYLPPHLKAGDLYTLFAKAETVHDEFGRALAHDLSVQFITDHRGAKFHLEHEVSVLEKDVDTDLPLIVTNLRSVELEYATLTEKGVTPDLNKKFTPYQARDIAYPYPLKIRELLGGVSGVVTGRIRAEPEYGGTTQISGYHQFTSQVTPYSVHVKLGHFNTLVWVTKFSDGTPVAGAQVTALVGTLYALTSNPETLATAVTDKEGVAILPGTEQLDPDLELTNAWEEDKPRLFFKVSQGSDLALVPVTYDLREYSSGADSWMRPRYGHLEAWGTTAQGIYKLGDTVQYKIYVRGQDNNGFTAPPPGAYSVQVSDPLGVTLAEFKDITLSPFGAFDGELKLPAKGAVGWYRFTLTSNFTKESYTPLSVLVSDFTPAPFKVTSELTKKQYQSGDTVELHSFAKLHAGGPYSDAATRVTALVRPTRLTVKDPQLTGFVFNSYSANPLEDQEGYYGNNFSSEQVYQHESKVDEKGELESSFSMPETKVIYGTLDVESAVRDDRGKYVTSNSTARFLGRTRYVGLRQNEWLLTKDRESAVEIAVVDQNLQMHAGDVVTLALEYREIKAARVKGAGNAYVTNYTTTWVSEARGEVISSADKPVPWNFTPLKAGQYRLSATVKDTDEKLHTTVLSQWAQGPGDVVWDTGQSNTLKIRADKEEYHVGDTAKFFVENPFPGAKALITTERYGVQKRWIKVLPTAAEVIEVPIDRDSLPGFYLSVVVVSPRVAQPLGENQVDLGKPAFRMGYITVPVKDRTKELVVTATPDRQQYKPRERVTLALSAKTQEGKVKPVEFAVAVLDQAVFDLIASGRAKFDPYQAFYKLDSLDVQNYNLIKQLIGRQKFEKKGASPGGDGGAALAMRSLFKYVSYWNPAVKADSEGRATVSFELPDSLTGWRVLALAVDKKDLMGLGESSFTVNKDTEIRAALANQIIEGDEVEALFTVMNRTDTTRTLQVNLSASGPIAEVAPVTRTISAEPYKRLPVSIKVKATGVGTITFKVTAGDARDSDGLIVTLKANKRLSLVSAALYGSTTGTSVSDPLLFPKDIRTDVGTVSVVLSPTVITDLAGAFTYLRDYPYLCWEQRLTKGAMAANYSALKSYLPKDLVWKEAEDVARQMLEDAASFQTPSGGMAYWTNEDRYADPYLSAYTALVFDWLSARGYVVAPAVQQKLDSYLGELLRKEIFPDFYTVGMASSVRAVALAALALRGKANVEDLQRFQEVLPQMNLFGKAHYLMAIQAFHGPAELSKRVVDMILAQGNETGGKFLFSEQVTLEDARILESSLRSNCALLSAFLGSEKVATLLPKDLPQRLVRAISQSRRESGHWENTQENIFCMNALYEYSIRYETEKPQMKYAVALGSEQLGTGRFRTVQDPPIEFDRKITAADPGRSSDVTITKEGTGRLYYSTRLFYAPLTLATTPANNGIELHREYSVERNGTWEIVKSPVVLKQGELVKVDLFLSLPAPRNFVVVDDPVPGGIEPVNRDLATASTVDAAKGEYLRDKHSYWFSHGDWIGFESSRWSFYHQELRHDAARFFSEYLPAGNYHLSWIGQTIAAGAFTALPTKAEEMYDPDVFGTWVPEVVKVQGAP